MVIENAYCDLKQRHNPKNGRNSLRLCIGPNDYGPQWRYYAFLLRALSQTATSKSDRIQDQYHEGKRRRKEKQMACGSS